MKRGKKQTFAKRIVALALMCAMIVSLLPYNQYESKASTGSSEYMNVEQTLSANEVYTDGTIDVNMSLTGIPNDDVTLPTDVVMVLDCSGSMSGSKISTLKTAAKDFISGVDFSLHRVGLVLYESTTTSVEFTTDVAALTEQIDGISAGGGTATHLAIDAAVEMMKTKKRSRAQPTIILLTDGEANSDSLALQAAEAAKSHAFYTVALLDNKANIDVSGTTEYKIAQLLRQMASTGEHYFFADVSGLPLVYQQIAGRIGIAYPRNVKVTQVLSDQFELVPDSVNTNIPIPTVSGQTIKWEMTEVQENAINLGYSIRVKDGVKPGTYPLTSKCEITYKKANNNSQKIVMTPDMVTVKYYPPEITSIDKTLFDARGGESFTIAGDKFYPSTKVYAGDVEIKDITVVDSNTIEGVMPAHAQGDYKLRVVSLAGDEATEDIKFQADPVVTSIEDAYGPYEGGNRITIRGNYFMEGVKVEFAGEEAEITAQRLDYLRVIVPFTGKEGEAVDITITNPDGTKTVLSDAYWVVERPKISVSSISPSTCQEGTANFKVKITATNLLTGDGFKVTIGGTEVTKYIVKSSSYVKFYAPTDIPAGTYDVEITNADGSKAVIKDGFTYTPKPVVPFPDVKLSPNFGYLGEAVTVKATGSGLFYATDFSISVGGKTVAPTNQTGAYFFFTVPTDLTVGVHDVVVTSEGVDKTVGQYTVNPIPTPPPLTNISMNVTSSQKGVEQTVRVRADGLDYSPGFKVTFGGTEITPAKTSNSFFDFVVPATTAEGVYDVVVYNGNNSSVATPIGQYEVIAKPAAPALTDYSLDVTSSIVGVEQRVKLTAKGIKRESGFKIMLGDREVKVTSHFDNKYARFRVPADMPKGIYDVKVYNGDGTTTVTTVGTFTVKEWIPPIPTNFVFDRTSGPAYSRHKVKLKANDLVCKDGFKVTIGGKEVKFIVKSSSYLRFYAPTDLSPGTYDVVVYNGNGLVGTNAGTYTLY